METLTPTQRETVNFLAGKMLAANATVPYDSHGYDAHRSALLAFLQSAIGKDIVDRIEATNIGWNWCGNATPADDVDAAIEYAVDDIFADVFGENPTN